MVWNKSIMLPLFICFLILFGCATTYQPMGFTGGYSDIQLDRNTVRVTFRGNAFVPKEKVETYLLYRCAETTLNLGFDYFIIVDNSSDVTRGAVTTPGSYSATTYGTGYGATTYGTYTPGQTVPYKKHGSSVIIKLFKGVKPEDLPNAFMAWELKGYLDPHIERPK